MGDSLSAGYGIRPGASLAIAAWRPRLVRKTVSIIASPICRSPAKPRPVAANPPAAGAQAAYQPAIVVIALGANDGLRGLPLSPDAR
jgi:acyl-CoA thioesterase-1